MRWSGNQVSWTDGDTTLIAEPKDLSKAQRRLYRMKEFPQVAKAVVGDVDRWLERRQEKLEQAKRVVGIDTALLTRKTTNKKLTETETLNLCSLLVAEALCVNLPTHSAIDYLYKFGPDSLPILGPLLEDDSAPEPARALASFIAGAVEHAHQISFKFPSSAASPWIKRAYHAGKNSGMVPNISTLVWFLSVSKGESLLPSASAIFKDPARVSFYPEDCRALLLTDTSPFEVVQILNRLSAVESYDDIVPSSRNIERQVEPEPKATKQKRPPKFKKEDARPHKHAPTRQSLIDTLRSLPARYAMRTKNAESIRLVDEYIRATSALDKHGFHLLKFIIQILEQGLQLNSEIAWHYIRLLHTHQKHLPPDVREQEGYREGTYENQNKTRVLDFLWFHVLKPFKVLLETSEDPDWVEYVIECNDLIVVAHCLDEFVPDENLLARANSLNKRANLNACIAIAQLVKLVHECRFLERDKKRLFAFLDAIGNCDKHHRSEIFRNLVPSIIGSNASPASLTASTLLVPILEHCSGNESDFITARTFWFIQLEKYCLEPDRKEMISWAIKYTLSHWDKISRSSNVLDIPMMLAGHDLKKFQKIFSVWSKYTGDAHAQLLEEGLGIVQKKYPKLLDDVATTFITRTKSSLDLLQTVALSERFQIDKAPFTRTTTKQTYAKEDPWRSLLEILPAHKEQIAKLHSAAQVLKLEKLPAALQDVLCRPTKMALELDFLQAQWESKAPPPKIAQRINKLSDSLSDAEALRFAQVDQLSKQLEQVSAELYIEATRKLVLDDLIERLGIAEGVASEIVDVGSQFLEAAALCSDLRVNKRLMKKLLSEATKGNRHWIQSHPANQRFLKNLEDQGINIDVWLSEFPKLAEEIDDIPNGPLKLYLERDPLHIMQMGNYFHTCLSFDGINAFSVVANATDLNKRVLYVLNSKGKVIARKLVAVNTNFELVGYRTYSRLQNLVKERTLFRIVDEYCETFAAACGMPLGDQGSVEHLVTSQWYDDSIRSWHQFDE
ncbi:hypothetical protein KF728_02175 [Candidatus Obscuribacterales bacterium]|nr:hypothetical protein [Candidatus Obscuribacterales bacterium]